MKSTICLFALLIITTANFSQEEVTAGSISGSSQSNQDSLRITELDAFWDELSKTVREGDLEGYASGYHDDAVVVFGSKTSVPIDVALESWKQGFVDTKAGKAKSNVEFRFSERVGDKTTAHETGMFFFTLADEGGKVQKYYANFEALLVKKDGNWKCIMEYQKSPATPEQWEAIK